MKVKDLIELLGTLPGDMEVIMSKDGEGNGFSPWCGDHSVGEYTPETTWYGEFSDSEEDDETGVETEIPVERQNAVVLWPVN